ncbi:hypothetical protein EWM64_g313 [Hericium alpestre]|uniref:Uncharacterized protein n=1 Tax=Hericium alpestre TaxID=135208 RepID=A0A4Z0AAE4_9AGAM|nr:hypothetical protein EWM64_g313 [Hericium alpestre]
MSEPCYASLTCEFWCQRCGKDDEICPIIWHHRIRLCKACISIDFFDSQPSAPSHLNRFSSWGLGMEAYESFVLLDGFGRIPVAKCIWKKRLVWRFEEALLSLTPDLQTDFANKVYERLADYEILAKYLPWYEKRWSEAPENDLQSKMTLAGVLTSHIRTAEIAHRFLGEYGADLSYIPNWYGHPLVHTEGTIWDSEWQDMKLIMIRHFDQLRSITTEHAKLKILNRQIYLATRTIDAMVKNGALPKLTSPMVADILLVPEVERLVSLGRLLGVPLITSKPSESTPDPGLEDLLPMIWETFIHRRCEQLLSSIERGTATIFDIFKERGTLDHPAAVFFCTTCSDVLDYPRVIMHACSYSPVSSAPLLKSKPVPKPMYAHAVRSRFGCAAWSSSSRYRVHPALDRIIALMKACGVDPVTGSVVDLNKADVRVRCSACAPADQRAMDWHTARAHAIEQHLHVQDDASGSKTISSPVDIVFSPSAERVCGPLP